MYLVKVVIFAGMKVTARKRHLLPEGQAPQHPIETTLERDRFLLKESDFSIDLTQRLS